MYFYLSFIPAVWGCRWGAGGGLELGIKTPAVNYKWFLKVTMEENTNRYLQADSPRGSKLSVE